MSKSRTDQPESRRRTPARTLQFPARQTPAATATRKVGSPPPGITTARWQEMLDAVRQLPEVEATRVVALYDRLQRGEYFLDIDQVAGGLLQLESLLDPKPPTR